MAGALVAEAHRRDEATRYEDSLRLLARWMVRRHHHVSSPDSTDAVPTGHSRPVTSPNSLDCVPDSEALLLPETMYRR